MAAGLGTFRGDSGLWDLHPELERAMDAAYIPDNVGLMWRYWGGIRELAVVNGPTDAHLALARIGATVITQNVDGLHTDAGSADVLELHGSADRARCLRCDWAGSSAPFLSVDQPVCPVCAAPVRPDVVLFGEGLDRLVLREAQQASASCQVFLSVGTSNNVAPANQLASVARAAGAICISVDPNPVRQSGDAFHEHVRATADDVLAQLGSAT